MARQRGLIRSRGSKRLVSWGVGPGSTGATTVTATGQTQLGSGLVLTVEDEVTIVRLRGYVELVMEALGAIGNGFAGAIGVGIVTAQAQTAGIGSLPHPLTNSAWGGWLYHRHFAFHGTTATIADGVNVGRIGWEVDSKAMRKFGSNDVLFAVLDVVEAGTAQMSVFFDTRLLVKLS